MKKTLLAGAIGAIVSMPSHAAFELLKTDNTTVTFGGYAKASLNVSKFSEGAPASSSLGRIYYVPSTIATSGGNGNNDDTLLDFTARETRFNFGTKTLIDGHVITSYLELDFMSGYPGDERTSNSTSPRLRHAYFTYDNWLFGQTFTTFENTTALPETTDFLPASDATVFNRQPMVRYTSDSGAWQFALENPETTYSPYNSASRVDEDNSILPDLVGRYNMKGDWGSLAVAGLVRQLRADTVDANGDVQDNETKMGFGVNLSGLLKAGDMDDFRFSVTAGEGIGRYVALNAFNSSNVKANGDLDTISTVSAFAAYRHFWTEKLRSSFVLSGTWADNNDTASQALTKSVQSVHANLMYSPVKPISFGAEIVYAERKLENNDKGDLTRLQLSAKYTF
ncbi:DcaP family trimeric outer membrane transporter [Gallaecimonas pentaromativorans]|uniref:DcaP family trimeric outer membrane transporter n=1 Tax=Gallaecimonas pentaromativorans TaxID=584787 RepID=UPI00067E7B58|nr:DcaP family trimeric outer membrane transporter [Gallaecimonas pentaromativorans]MED5525452.1 DcaP family trimeric outer membrane transporter [Pseudomonadota bacterium]